MKWLKTLLKWLPTILGLIRQLWVFIKDYRTHRIEMKALNSKKGNVQADEDPRKEIPKKEPH